MSSEEKVIEPTYNLHFKFENGSNPYLCYHKSLNEVCDILKKWNENWILIPEELSVTGGTMCYSMFGDTYFLNFVLRERSSEK